MAYYNTNNEFNPTLQESKERALRQQNKVLSYFQSFPSENFSAEEVWKAITADNTPLTSIRRAITDLTVLGKLIKTENMKVSSFGKKCHTWTMASYETVLVGNQKELVF